MLTRNYYAMSAMQCFHGALPTAISIRRNSGSYFRQTAYDRYTYFGLLPDSLSDSYSVYTRIALAFGSNDADESIEDYTLGTIYKLVGTIGTYNTPTYDSENKTITITRRYVLTNNTANSITVQNFGVLNGVQEALGTEGCVIFRRKLNEPFTIDVGESVNFDLTLTFDLPVDFVPYVPA